MRFVNFMSVTPPATFEQAIARLEVQTREIKGLWCENNILREQLQILRLGMFGRRSERLAPGQLALFERAADDQEVEVVEPEPQVKSQKKPKKGHGRAPFPNDLPREVIELDVPENERFCPDCDAAMLLIGEDIAERGHIIPARLVIRRYVKKKYACPAGHGVKTAKAPDGVIDKGKFEASVYAYVATAKYADHLPLHRLEGIFKRHGLHLRKQTMWDLLVTVDELVAQPVLKQMRTELLSEPVLHSDETPVTMRIEDGKGTCKTYAWGWRNLRGVGDSKVLIEFRMNRSRDGPLEFLGEWSGTLISDGYRGYDRVILRNGIVRAGCMAHARRKVKDALETGAKKAVRLLRPMQRLFWIERAIGRRAERTELSREELLELRRRVRERRSRVVWEQLCDEAATLRGERSTLPKSMLGKALGYLDRQRRALSVFLTDPRIPIHNNDSERDLRHVAVGRKNWSIFASPRGGDVACRLYSLMLSCKQSGVDPEAYLEDVLMKVATTPASEIATLTPWGWKAARAENSPPQG